MVPPNGIEELQIEFYIGKKGKHMLHKISN